jgi:hypothetical protein
VESADAASEIVAESVIVCEETAIPIGDDTPTNEDRFGQRGVKEHSGWSDAAAVAITIIIVGLVFYYRAKLAAL